MKKKELKIEEEEIEEDQGDSIRFDESKSGINLGKLLKILNNIEGLDQRKVVNDLLFISPEIKKTIESRKEEWTHKEVVDLIPNIFILLFKLKRCSTPISKYPNIRTTNKCLGYLFKP